MALSIKFPIGSRVTHKWSGPATVIGAPFKGGDGVTHLPVKFDNPEHDGFSGYHERNFTLIEPSQAPDPLDPLQIGFSAWAKNSRTVALMERCARAEAARDNLQKMLDEQEVEMRKVDKLQSELRMMTKLKDIAQRNRARIYDKAVELEKRVQQQKDFISVQAGRLARARDCISRMRAALDGVEELDT